MAAQNQLCLGKSFRLILMFESKAGAYLRLCPLGLVPVLTRKDYARLEMLSRDKRSSLFVWSKSDEERKRF